MSPRTSKHAAEISEPSVALSVRQPWATLIVFGIKTIEIRSWSSKRVGPIYIHAGQSADRRDEGWKFVPKHLQEFTEQRGGLVGQAHLVECVRYDTPDQFARDVRKHFNNPNWFAPPRMFGLVLKDPKPCPFLPCRGDLYFFPVEPHLRMGKEGGRPAE